VAQVGILVANLRRCDCLAIYSDGVTEVGTESGRGSRDDDVTVGALRGI
jgi:hypothetical protein